MTGIAFGQTGTTHSAPAVGGGMSSILGFLPIILIFAVLYFLMIMPQQRRQKKHQRMIEQLKRGDRIVLASGIHGIITTVREQTFLVKVAENAELEVDKSAVSYKFGTQQ
jgi:preprotein translocase subunit YajC